MKNKRQRGDILIATATGADAKSGDVVEIGDLVGVWNNDVSEDSEGPVSIAGVFEVPKTTGAWDVGDALQYNGTAFLKGTVGTDTNVGHAARDEESGTELGWVLLGARVDGAGGGT